MNLSSILGYITESNLDIKITETFHKLNIEVIINSFYKIDSQFITSLLNIIPSRDSIFSFLLIYNESNETEMEEKNIDKFLNDIEDSIAISGNITSTKLNIQINKSLDQPIISIYSMESFGYYLKLLKTSNLLTILSNKAKLGFIIFEVIDYNSDLRIDSSSIAFIGSSIHCNKEKITDYTLIKAFKSVCNFQTSFEYEFIPNDFCIIDVNNDIDLVFKKLKIIYSLIYIFDISNLTDNYLTLNLNGKKYLEVKLSLNDLNFENLTVYYEIYEWLYTDGNISDKIGITRNILSLYLKDANSIEIDYSAFTAIKSNYAIYLKDNVEKYLEVKSKIIDTLLSTNTQIGALVDSLTNNFIKNLGAIGTFIFSITVMKSLDDKKFQDIFTYDIIIISFFLVLISVIYFKYTINEYDYSKKRMQILYDRLKMSYGDILVDKDIEIIFNKDEYFSQDLEAADTKVEYYKKLWCTILLIFELAVIILGFFSKL